MIPSRHSNPFATCWTRPGALAFRFANGESAAALVERLAARQWWGEIIGPHGSGKSTLLATLRPLIEHFRIRSIGWLGSTEGSPQRAGGSLRSTPATQPLLAATGQQIEVVDGYEQLSQFARWRLRRRCRRERAGLLVTSHFPTGLPTLIELAPDEKLVQQIVAELSAATLTPITPADASASHARRGGNVREILFDLYDRHERLSRLARTREWTAT